MLEERQMCGQDHELTRVRPIQISSIPDTLYMVEDPQYIQQFMTFNPTPLHNIDIVSGTIPGLCSIRASGVHFDICINLVYFRKFKENSGFFNEKYKDLKIIKRTGDLHQNITLGHFQIGQLQWYMYEYLNFF